MSSTVVNTRRGAWLDHQRKQLGVAGEILRDQQAKQYVLVTAGDSKQLGDRWRDALTALRALAGKSARR